MEEKFYIDIMFEQLLRQYFYAGKLSSIRELDEAVSLVKLPHESAVLGELVYYHSSKGKDMIEKYIESGYSIRDAKSLEKNRNAMKEIIIENAGELGNPSEVEIRELGEILRWEVAKTIADEIKVEPDDVHVMLSTSKSLGLIAQLEELATLEGMDLDTITDLLFNEEIKLQSTLDDLLIEELSTYTGINLKAYHNYTTAAIALSEKFDEETKALSSKGKQKVLL